MLFRTNLYIWVQRCGKMCRQRMLTECTKQRYKNKNDKRNDRDKEWENGITNNKKMIGKRARSKNEEN